MGTKFPSLVDPHLVCMQTGPEIRWVRKDLNAWKKFSKDIDSPIIGNSTAIIIIRLLTVLPLSNTRSFGWRVMTAFHAVTIALVSKTNTRAHTHKHEEQMPPYKAELRFFTHECAHQILAPFPLFSFATLFRLSRALPLLVRASASAKLFIHVWWQKASLANVYTNKHTVYNTVYVW